MCLFNSTRISGKTSTETSKNDLPPRYESCNKPTTSDSKVGVAYHPNGHDHAHDHAHVHTHDHNHGHNHGHVQDHAHGHNHGHTHDHVYGHAHKGSQPTAPPYGLEYANVDSDIGQAKSCESQAGYVEVYESEPLPTKTGHHWDELSEDSYLSS